ncbi:unnamed protein product [Psylliodes chrysocephalus]|uniref:Uncharacterized protein n=1 Tax=Psylliodes chrysocephalus TaxID=3402493 RepID=A0A9P0GF81_9CUCU|nr:unnamed protein product [Psylliodes chrysocephala]
MTIELSVEWYKVPILVDLGTGELAAPLQIEQGFPPLNTVRRKYKPKLFDYEQRDETPQDSKAPFKINFFLKIIDQTLSSLNSRFEMISDYNIFGFFSDILKLNVVLYSKS